MVAKLRLLFTITIVFLSFYGTAQNTYWKKAKLNSKVKSYSKKQLKVNNAVAFTLDESLFKAVLKNKNTNLVYFPDERGDIVGYSVQETSLFADDLAQKYPNIKSYKGVDVNDSKRQIWFSVSHKGLQSMTQEAGKNDALYMHKTDADTYVLYRRSQQTIKKSGFICNTLPKVEKFTQRKTGKLVADKKLRIYRIAISASGEYTRFHGGTKADALAAINATLTRVNGVFERDLAIRLQLIANTDAVIYTNPDTDPYTGSLKAEAQSTFDAVIGAENYDVGHLFNQQENTLDGNAGSVGAVCNDNSKGSAYTTLGTPIGDAFDIDLVIHELGHQFGANHSFSHTSEGSLVQVEPASGTTIMGYAGIVGVNNVAEQSDDYFHYVSIKQIQEYLKTVSCGQLLNLTNEPPQLSSLVDYTIPKGTAFVLDAKATDDDGDTLTYVWDQIDNGVVTQATFGPNNPSGANFRSLPPTESSKRYFPKLERVLNGQLIQSLPTVGDAWETVSNIGRELNFAVTVRDNAAGGAQLVSDKMKVNVVSNSGPFSVTSQGNEVSYVAGTVQAVEWDVANTNVAPIAITTVDVFLSTDGGFTYPIKLLENTPNDGEQNIIVPSVDTTRGRIMVKPSNSIFYAVNKTDFIITPSEIILDFDQVSFDVCKQSNFEVNFNYETYLGFNEEVTFIAVDFPQGLSATFTPVKAVDTDTPVTISFTGINDLEEGVYPIKIRASSLTLAKDIVLEVDIFDANFNDVNLTYPEDNSIDISTDIIMRWDSSIESTSFDIEIAADKDFVNIVDATTVFINEYSSLNLNNDTDYFWRVKPKNDCGEGVFSSAFSYKTIQFNCETKAANDQPIEISNSGTSKVSSKIIFYEDLPIVDINVNLDIEHSFVADLLVNLISPKGTVVTLVSSSCGEFDGILATFDDEANPFVCGVAPAISGRVRPLGELSSFIGESIQGEWTLEVSDNATSDGGRLNGFSLEICVQGDFRPDADQDGIFDDGPDLCLDTPIGQEVNINGCSIYRFPTENFTIKAESVSCRGSEDGEIAVNPKLITLDYQIQVIGSDLELIQDFTDSFQLSKLKAGTYKVCIFGTDGMVSYEPYCADIEITQPDPLEVTSNISLDGQLIMLSLKGSKLYNIDLNGVVTQTQEDNIVLDLKKGINTLKIFTNLACQGTYNAQVGNYENSTVVPNPVIEKAEMYVGFDDEVIQLKIFSANGKWLKDIIVYPFNGKIVVDFTSLSSGLYFLKYYGETVKGTLKVIKK